LTRESEGPGSATGWTPDGHADRATGRHAASRGARRASGWTGN